MLLVNLAHTFELADEPGDAGARAAGALINRTFAEMYNLRAIAGTLVELPARLGPRGPVNAGPPFEMPYTLALARRERDRWGLHRNLLDVGRAHPAAPAPADGPATSRRLIHALALEQVRAARARRRSAAVGAGA